MTSLVHHHRADLTLIPLLPNPPDELLAVSAEGRLPQEQSHELVAGDLVDLSTHRTSALPHKRAGALLEDALLFTRILGSFWKTVILM